MSLYSVDDYANALASLLPVGLAWTHDVKSTQYATLRSLGHSLARSDTDSQTLLRGSFPSTASIMLSEWESALGLPDDCAIGEVGNIIHRQRAVVSRLISTGGLSRNYYIDIAKSLGYEIMIDNFRPAMCAMSVCGEPINGEEWSFTWRITTFGSSLKYSYAGTARCGDAIASWGDKAFECAINKIAPSHINIIFSYLIGNDFDIPEFRAIFDIAINNEWPKSLPHI